MESAQTGWAQHLLERLRRLGRNLRAGARLALFQRVDGADFASDAIDFAVLATFNLAIWLASAYARADFSGELNAPAVMTYLATLPVLMFAALMAAVLCHRRDAALTIAVALVASDWVFEIASQLLARFTPLAALVPAFMLVLVVWIFVTALRAVRVGATAERGFVPAGLVVVALLALVLYAFPQAEPWAEPEGDESAPALSDERLFHQQGELIEKELAAIEPGRPGVPELYFVGFAPDGSQDVFVREMRYVRDLFQARYATRGRSTMLASGETTLSEHPLATATNLRRVLERIGAAMNDHEDVLFLFVSAHGDRDHQLSAWQRGLDPQLLNPTALARMLNDAGIRSRVVVVSACYSGGFIEPLRDEDSMIITAASADRTSFGCEHGSDFTYFGRAFFREGLGGTRSFAQAFTLAKEAVTRQETEEGKEPSQPQLWQGSGIAARLAPFEQAAPNP